MNETVALSVRALPVALRFWYDAILTILGNPRIYLI
eukprot:SAG31_NODE_29728_length_390_cov_3.886598_1_plen_35_part_01